MSEVNERLGGFEAAASAAVAFRRLQRWRAVAASRGHLQASLRVAVRGACGEPQLELEAAERETVAELRRKISGGLGHPEVCLVLRCGTAVLEDGATLGALLAEQAARDPCGPRHGPSDPRELQVVAVRTTEELATAARQDPRAAADTVRRTGRTAERGDSWAVEGLLDFLQHPRDTVKRAAMESLPKVADRGCERAVQAACHAAASMDTPLRLLAVRALPQLAAKDCRPAVDALHACLKDRCGLVRIESREALRAFCQGLCQSLLAPPRCAAPEPEPEPAGQKRRSSSTPLAEIFAPNSN